MVRALTGIALSLSLLPRAQAGAFDDPLFLQNPERGHVTVHGIDVPFPFHGVGHSLTITGLVSQAAVIESIPQLAGESFFPSGVPGLVLCNLTFIRYDASNIETHPGSDGAYRELVVAFLLAGTGPQLPRLYQHKLLLDEQLPIEAGIVFGFDKERAALAFRFPAAPDARRHVCIRRGGRTVLRASLQETTAPSLPVFVYPFDYVTSSGFGGTSLNKGALRVGADGAPILFDGDDHLVLGTDPLAQFLASLGFSPVTWNELPALKIVVEYDPRTTGE